MVRLTRRAALGSLVGPGLSTALPASAAPAFQVRRLVDAPIVTAGMDARMGADIEGPSLIWRAWKASPPVEVIRPEREREGANLPVAPSYRSAVYVPVNQLRDQAIFEEGARTYLLYALKGEAGIGIAELSIQ